MTDKDILIGMIKANGNCLKVVENCGQCPLNYGSIWQGKIKCGQGHDRRKEDVIRFFIDLFGDDELMKGLL